MGANIPATHLAELEQVARPLLQLIQHITGMETSFITAIDWENQQQDVLFSLNTGEMQLAEDSRVDWGDSMCRSMFLAGLAQRRGAHDWRTEKEQERERQGSGDIHGSHHRESAAPADQFNAKRCEHWPDEGTPFFVWGYVAAMHAAHASSIEGWAISR